MTAPVITTYPKGSEVDVLFVIKKGLSLNDLPEPESSNISFQEFDIGKAAAIKFGFWATPNRIKNKKTELKEYLNKNLIDHSTVFYVAQYNSPWVIPPFRKNEIIVSIN